VGAPRGTAPCSWHASLELGGSQRFTASLMLHVNPGLQVVSLSQILHGTPVGAVPYMLQFTVHGGRRFSEASNDTEITVIPSSGNDCLAACSFPAKPLQLGGAYSYRWVCLQESRSAMESVLVSFQYRDGPQNTTSPLVAPRPTTSESRERALSPCRAQRRGCRWKSKTISLSQAACSASDFSCTEEGLRP
jgi:hypothetical protein